MSAIPDEYHYFTLRRQILTISTKSEYARANRIASQMDPTHEGTTRGDTSRLSSYFAHMEASTGLVKP